MMKLDALQEFPKLIGDFCPPVGKSVKSIGDTEFLLILRGNSQGTREFERLIRRDLKVDAYNARNNRGDLVVGLLNYDRCRLVSSISSIRPKTSRSFAIAALSCCDHR
ncbi:hypothetical protein [Bradyrhizobium shewense]|nr:hypothetical protein [Bradyrhizobium shewense]